MLVSIVIPTYNHADALPALLQSIAKQTHKKIEVIIVDDGSKDDPSKVVNDIVATGYPYKVTCLSQANMGAPAARNRGADEAHGDFVMFADADLLLKKNAIEKLINKLQQNPDASYAYASFIFGRKKFKAIEFNEELLKKQNYIHTSALIRKADMIKFDESLKRFQDWDLWLTMLEQGKRGVAVRDVLFKVRITRIGISSWRPKLWYKIWPIFGWQPKSYSNYSNAKEVIIRKHNLC